MLTKSPDSVFSVVSPASSASPASSSFGYEDLSLCYKDRACCPICGGVSHNKHFGIATCNACAAFFRRTIAHQRRYTCVRGKQCHITHGNARHLCRFCRFQRCIKEGMNIGAVFVRSTDEYRAFEPDSPLRTILLSQRGTFVNRYTSQLKAYNGNHAAVKLGMQNPNFKSTIVTITSEFSVLKEYLNASGFREMGLTGAKFNELAVSVFYSWLCYNSIMCTLRNAGQKTSVAYFIDESHIKVNDDDITSYVQTLDGLLDYHIVTGATKRFFNTALEVASQIHVSRTEEVEHAAMFHLFVLKVADKIFPENKVFSESINDLFSHLRRHYDKNFDDTALKLGNMVLMLSALEKCTKVFNDYITLLYLNGYSTILGKLLSEMDTNPAKCKIEPKIELQNE